MKTPEFNINAPVAKEKDVPCPSCGAKPDMPCKNADGTAKVGTHQPRFDLFNRTKQYQDRMKR